MCHCFISGACILRLHSPQENGVAERGIRSSSELIVAMLSDAGLDRKWRGECLPQATYLSNVTSSTASACSWQMVKGSKPSVDTLRTFGCIVWVHVPSELRGSKKDWPVKSVLGRYLGYDFPNFTAHRVLLHPMSVSRSASIWIQALCLLCIQFSFLPLLRPVPAP